MQLGKQGYVSIVEIILYVPILAISVILVVRNGFSRRAGWIMLLVLAIIRIIGSIIQLVSTQHPSNLSLVSTAAALESAGLSPLLIAAVGILGAVGQYTLDDTWIMTRGLRLMGLLGSLAVALTVVGGSNIGSAKDQSKLNNAETLRRVGTIMILVLFVLVAGVAVWFFTLRERILKYRRQLLLAVLASLPFLFVRVLYAVLGAFAQPTFGFDADGNKEVVDRSGDPLQTFASTTGSFALSVVMALVMEYATVLLYTVVGMLTPLHKDEVSLTLSLPTMYDIPATATAAEPRAKPERGRDSDSF